MINTVEQDQVAVSRVCSVYNKVIMVEQYQGADQGLQCYLIWLTL